MKLDETKKELKKYKYVQLINEEHFTWRKCGETIKEAMAQNPIEVRKSLIGITTVDNILSTKFNYLKSEDVTMNNNVPVLMGDQYKNETVSVLFSSISDKNDMKTRSLIYGK